MSRECSVQKKARHWRSTNVWRKAHQQSWRVKLYAFSRELNRWRHFALLFQAHIFHKLSLLWHNIRNRSSTVGICIDYICCLWLHDATATLRFISIVSNNSPNSMIYTVQSINCRGLSLVWIIPLGVHLTLLPLILIQLPQDHRYVVIDINMDLSSRIFDHFWLEIFDISVVDSVQQIRHCHLLNQNGKETQEIRACDNLVYCWDVRRFRILTYFSTTNWWLLLFRHDRVPDCHPSQNIFTSPLRDAILCVYNFMNLNATIKWRDNDINALLDEITRWSVYMSWMPRAPLEGVMHVDGARWLSM